MPFGKEVGLGPGHIVLDGGQWGPIPTAASPHFRPMSIVAKRSPISATAELLYTCSKALLRLYFSWNENYGNLHGTKPAGSHFSEILISKQLQLHDSVHLSSVYTYYSFSSILLYYLLRHVSHAAAKIGHLLSVCATTLVSYTPFTRFNRLSVAKPVVQPVRQPVERTVAVRSTDCHNRFDNRLNVCIHDTGTGTEGNGNRYSYCWENRNKSNITGNENGNYLTGVGGAGSTNCLSAHLYWLKCCTMLCVCASLTEAHC